jgi:hypothetical protein
VIRNWGIGGGGGGSLLHLDGLVSWSADSRTIRKGSEHLAVTELLVLVMIDLGIHFDIAECFGEWFLPPFVWKSRQFLRV